MKPVSYAWRITALAAWLAPPLFAQGVASATIQGTVREAETLEVDGAHVRATNISTGYFAETRVRHGRFLLQGLDVGGPYVVRVRMVGFEPQELRVASLSLGGARDVHFELRRVAASLDSIVVRGSARRSAHAGVATRIADSFVRNLPTIDRNFFDFVRLVPQMTTKVGPVAGLSGGGVNFRFNSYLIDGVPERFLSGNSSLAIGGGKSVPLDAVREYEVLLTPFDVRYGDFAGALINTVTFSGTNHFRGSVFAYARNDRLARGGELASATPYDRAQFGFSVGGPIIRDRVHFFIAPELQRFVRPAEGPYVGQPKSASPIVPVRESDLEKLSEIMSGYGLVSGSGGPVENHNPLANVFGRADFALPRWNSRAVVSLNYVRNTSPVFSRSATSFPLSSYTAEQQFWSRLSAAQIHTTFRRGGGGHNELLLSHRREAGAPRSHVDQPVVHVVLPATTGGSVVVTTGTVENAQNVYERSATLRIADNLTLPLGAAHRVTFGGEIERFRFRRGGLSGSFGSWSFSSLDSLADGLAERFELRRDFGTIDVPISGSQYAAHASDRWRPTQHLEIMLGLRADVLELEERPRYNALVDTLFAFRTDQMPRPTVHLSPRAGFIWRADGAASAQLRGGIGIFTGRPPMHWYRAALVSYGVIRGTLRCGTLPSDAGLAPLFVPERRAAPVVCANGRGLSNAALGEVDILDRNLKMAQTLRTSLSYERQLPAGFISTTDLLLTRNISDFVFENLNLRGPQSVDRRGRVMYGVIGPTGNAAPALKSNFAEVIFLRNTSENRSHQLSQKLEKRFAGGFATLASYTYSRVRDVQSPIRAGTTGAVIWGSGRVVSGKHDETPLTVSLYDIPHRAVLAMTYGSRSRKWLPRLAFYYIAESGAPFTYIARGTGRRGDLNADGSNANDPIFVPRSAFDTTEIMFSGRVDSGAADNSPATQLTRIAAQQAAFERFIEEDACLRRQRGRILERNSCRGPSTHTTIGSVRQSLGGGVRGLEAELQVFNLLNLTYPKWGRYRVASPAPLEHVGQTAGSQSQTQSIFRFDASAPRWTTLREESAFQLQFALRYKF